MTDGAYRRLICEIGRRMYGKDLIAANEGNLSVRLGDRLLATPTGICKGYMQPEDLVETDLDGHQVSGSRKVSSEILMHCVVYRHRPDVAAVCHGHPLYATAHAVAGIPLTEALMPEVVVTLGCVPLAPYGTPSTDELANSLVDLVPRYDALLLSNHGAITYASDLEKSFFKMEILEHCAKIAILTRILGRQTLLSRQAVDKLFDLREKYGINSVDFRQAGCPVTADEGAATVTLSRDELEELVEKVIVALIETRG
ncbi:MAG: class II aldolase/adducin family protein [Acidobacteriota bacterium]